MKIKFTSLPTSGGKIQVSFDGGGSFTDYNVEDIRESGISLEDNQDYEKIQIRGLANVLKNLNVVKNISVSGGNKETNDKFTIIPQNSAVEEGDLVLISPEVYANYIDAYFVKYGSMFTGRIHFSGDKSIAYIGNISLVVKDVLTEKELASFDFEIKDNGDDYCYIMIPRMRDYGSHKATSFLFVRDAKVPPDSGYGCFCSNSITKIG